MTNTQKVLQALRNHAEGTKGDEWQQVYLDNAKPADMTANQFRACLSALAKLGVYRVIDGYAWGDVKMED